MSPVRRDPGYGTICVGYFAAICVGIGIIFKIPHKRFMHLLQADQDPAE